MTEPAAAVPTPDLGEGAAATTAGGTESPTVAGTETLVRRNDRILLLAVGAYIVLLSTLMILRGVSITPDVLLVALGLAAVILGRGRLFLRDWIPFIGLFFAYELMRGYADNFGADVHVTDIVSIERAISFGALPTQVLQEWLHPATGVDPVAVASTVLYFLHFPLPLAVGFFLWLRRRRTFYDFVAALIVLSMAGFVTYLILPVAPPWWAAQHGFLLNADGSPAVLHLKDGAFDAMARALGFDGSYVYSYTIYDINPNEVAAFPSLHAGYPFLAFLFARRAFGRVGWLMLVYAVAVWFAIVYLGEHYVVDVIGGVVYASASYWAVIHAPGWFRRIVDRAVDPELEASVEAADAGDIGALGRLGRHVRWSVVGQGAVLAAIGAAGVAVLARTGAAGGAGTPLYLVPWALLLGGAWRAAVGLLSR